MQLCREHDSERGKETIAQMRQLIEELRVLSEQGRQDPENEDIIAEILDNNVRFHLQIINYSESRIFLTLFHAHSNSILKYTSQNYSFSPRMSSICEEHGLILDAIESGDEMAGFTAVREHMESARDRSLQAYQNQAEAS